MKPPIVIIGIGELASVFARAFLRSGYPVYPVTRGMSMAQEAEDLPDPQMVLVAVAERDFTEVMLTIPARWRDRLVLMQNELLPRDWQAYGIEAPTVISVWFEKKKGMDYNPLIPSPIYGRGADLLARSLSEIEIPCRILDTAEDLVFELVLKNVFVYTINIAGLVLDDGTTTSMLWQHHEQLTRDVAADIIVLQEAVTEKSFSRDALLEGLLKGINGDPDHKCRGRAAPGRLARAIEAADRTGVDLPTIRDINRRL
ncbi:hypothetical protein D1AOALGA4SA_13130 [Olavius algarvensis Delta 1 endosymbiont]|nr:hypothetical protein D1AOALGA4SA_13130 [Olavius algarvensis Delta 1 endosymbiont]